MLRHLLIGLGIFLGISVVLCIGYTGFIALMIHSFTGADPYPAFMAEAYEQNGRPTSYDQAKRIFSELITRTFPTGSAAERTISEISSEGFKVTASGPESVELLWNRHAGPCRERYYVIIQKDAGGKIARISGQMSPICL